MEQKVPDSSSMNSEFLIYISIQCYSLCAVHNMQSITLIGKKIDVTMGGIIILVVYISTFQIQ